MVIVLDHLATLIRRANVIEPSRLKSRALPWPPRFDFAERTGPHRIWVVRSDKKGPWAMRRGCSSSRRAGGNWASSCRRCCCPFLQAGQINRCKNTGKGRSIRARRTLGRRVRSAQLRGLASTRQFNYFQLSVMKLLVRKVWTCLLEEVIYFWWELVKSSNKETPKGARSHSLELDWHNNHVAPAYIEKCFVCD